MNGHKIINQGEMHFVTFTVVGWVDVFIREDYCKIIVDSLNYCINYKGLKVYGYVIMSSHIHLIVSTPDTDNLSDVIRDFKSFTSKAVLKSIVESTKESRQEWMLRLFKYYAQHNKRNKTYQFWKQDNKPMELSSIKWKLQKLKYIHLNPVKSGIVEKAEYYKYSSASSYFDESKLSLIQLSLMDIPGTLNGIIK